MTRKIGFLLFSLLLVTAMILSSCGTPTTTNPTAVTITGSTKATTAATTQSTTTAATTSTAATTTTAGAETMVDTLGKTILKPQYGGTYNMASTVDIFGFDNAYTYNYNYNMTSLNMTNEPLVAGDWTKGPFGTGEAAWQQYGVTFLPKSTGYIAESWEIPDGQTIIYHIRHGIHFQSKPPVNGRELKASDVVFSLKRDFETPGSYCAITYKGADAPTSITATDDWTVKITCNTGKQGPLFIVLSGYVQIFPADGAGADGTFRDWKTSNGTGFFRIADYVPMSSSTYVKNPDYWRKDPLTGMQIPYLDKMILLVIPDMTTIIAGLQTGKIDSYLGVPWDQADALKKTAPELVSGSYKASGTLSIQMALGKGFPWDKKEVRYAISRAIDRDKIMNEYFGGNADKFSFPIAPIPEFMGMFMPFSELPQSTQDIYTYNVAAAKQLMKDAGEEAGFTAEIICSTALQSYVDTLSLVAGMLKQINITMVIKPLEMAVWTSQNNTRSFPNWTYDGDGNGSPYKMNAFRPGNPQNAGNIDSPQLVDVYNQVNTYYPFDTPKAEALIRAQAPYILENCWNIFMPAAYSYWFAQPWVHNYDGVIGVGYFTAYNPLAYRWIDVAAKAKGK